MEAWAVVEVAEPTWTPSSNYEIESTASTTIKMKALSWNEDYVELARIQGSADRGIESAPSIPTYNKKRKTQSGIAYSGRNRQRVARYILPFILNIDSRLELASSGSRLQTLNVSWDLPDVIEYATMTDPWAWGYGDTDAPTIFGGTVDTD